MKVFKLLFLLFPCVTLAQVPNCVPIRGDYLWMSKTEVSNEFYTHFLQHISDEDSIKNYPEEVKWRNAFNYNEPSPMEEYYFRHPAYKKYPVVNVTYEQATNYCNWLTETLNKKYSYQKVLVRLPTEKEWEDAAKGGNKYANYPWGTESMRVEDGKNKGNFHANFVLKKGITMMDGATITAPVTSYWPNDFGLYNMSGNVSEMVSEKGLVKGGSWKNRADWLRIDKKQYVFSASPEVGFRYMVEIIELPQPKKKPKHLVLNKKFFKKYFAEINDTLSIGKYEVTNELYATFLYDLNDSLFRTKKKEWIGKFPYSNLWASNYDNHLKFKNHPAVNIDYEFATAFCAWLNYRCSELFDEKIEIRLPTQKEWELAARGGLENAPYPWGGSFVRNSKGCFLANHNPKMSESENVNGYDTLSLNNFFQTHFTDLHDFDGEAVLAPVDSYFPNGYGLHNMAGNAAEIVLDSNYTKGGSWKSKSYFLQIDSEEEWDKKANPFTGFRVVMIR
ncbi:MAG: SUMF1/EgtB/PvdO family nonheme iron enzyme [Flavobacteriales bacterium]